MDGSAITTSSKSVVSVGRRPQGTVPRHPAPADAMQVGWETEISRNVQYEMTRIGKTSDMSESRFIFGHFLQLFLSVMRR